jgi:hypothetical protein
MAAPNEFFLYEDADEEADTDVAEGAEEKSTDPPNRALPDILKIVSVFLPSVGTDGRLLSTDIPDRLKKTFFKGDGEGRKASRRYAHCARPGSDPRPGRRASAGAGCRRRGHGSVVDRLVRNHRQQQQQQ